jgi:hypothetical protein
MFILRLSRIKKTAGAAVFNLEYLKNYLLLVFSHFWLATVQDVLHADWQEV